jgi:hypothetical protein
VDFERPTVLYPFLFSLGFSRRKLLILRRY